MKLKDYIYILAVLFLGTSVSSAQFFINPYVLAVAGGGGGGGTTYTYLLSQDWDGAGLPSGWYAGGTGSSDPDFTPSIDGTESLNIVQASQYYTSFNNGAPFAATANLTLVGMFKATTFPGDYQEFIALNDVSSVATILVAIESNKIYIQSGAGSDAGVMTISTGTTYYYWLEYEKNTGVNNGKGRIYISTTTTKPGSPDASFTNGTLSNDTVFAALGRNSAGTTLNITYDHVRVIAGTQGTVTDWAL